MAPRLMRFYGGSAREWLATPFGVAMLFHAAMAPLQAAEAVAQSTVAMMGNQLGLEDPVELRNHWLEEAGSKAPERKQSNDKKLDAQAVKDAFAGFGVGFKEEKKNG